MSSQFYAPAEAFPSTKTAAKNKLITENALTRLINRLLDVDGYVITNQLNADEGIEQNSNIPAASFIRDFEFVIHGYYFNIGNLLGLFEVEDGDGESWTEFVQGKDEAHLGARIFIDKILTDYPELCGQDIEETNGYFKGLTFIKYTDNKPSPVGPDGSFDPETQAYYDLEIIRYGYCNDGDTEKISFVPQESLHKFAAKSIASIDGGVI